MEFIKKLPIAFAVELVGFANNGIKAAHCQCDCGNGNCDCMSPVCSNCDCGSGNCNCIR